MKLKIEAIGRVKAAEVEVNGLTLVSGGNASGKTTISKSLYSALTSTYHLDEKAEMQKERSIDRAIAFWLRGVSYSQREAVMRNPEVKSGLESLFWNESVSKNDFLEYLRGISDFYFKKLLPDIENEKLYEKYYEIMQKPNEYYRNYVIQGILSRTFEDQINTIGRNDSSRIYLEEGNTGVSLLIENNKLVTREENGTMTLDMRPIYIASSGILNSIEKQFILLGRDVILGDEIETLLLNDLSLEALIAEEYHAVEEQKKTVEEILTQIVDGDLRKESSRLVYYDNWCHSNVELSNIASGVKIFAIIKRLISNGSLLGENVLIIDEPETNLHPEWQLKLAELLVLLYARLGVRVYANTHSPYFLRAMEFYAAQHDVLDKCNFYFMERCPQSGMFVSKDVTQTLGMVYDKLAAPFNEIM